MDPALHENAYFLLPPLCSVYISFLPYFPSAVLEMEGTGKPDYNDRVPHGSVGCAGDCRTGLGNGNICKTNHRCCNGPSGRM